MYGKRYSIIVTGVVLLLMAAGVAGSVVGQDGDDRPPVVSAPVSSGISYQGRLTSAAGGLLSGNYMMRFIVFDDEVAGAALSDSGNMMVAVENGLFNVQLGVDQAAFNG